LLGDYINEKKRLISFGKWMQVQICQAVNTHKQTTGETVVVYEQRRREKREGRGGTGACDTMWSNRVTEESTRQPRKRALGHAHALVTLSLSLSLWEALLLCRREEEREREDDACSTTAPPQAMRCCRSVARFNKLKFK